MFFQVDPADQLAIYEQIVRQIKFAVADRSLKPGELVPSVRELARSLAINPNTVARAYRELQDDRILEAVRGTGLAVTPEAFKSCQKQRRSLLRDRIRQVFREAASSGIDKEELDKIVEEESGKAYTDG